MTNNYHSGMVAVLGRPNVGKSTLTNAMVGEKVAIVSGRPQTTRNRIMGVATGPDWQIVFLDTPGIHAPRNRLGEYMVKSAYDALEGIDVLLVLVEAGHILPQDVDLVEAMGERKVPKVLLINKCDTVEKSALLPLIGRFAEAGYDHILPVSALRGEGLSALRELLVTMLPEGPQYFPEDMVTDQPERVICAEIIREKALRLLREEVPHGVGVEMMSMQKLSDDLMEIHATIYVERPSHKGIVIGKQGSMLKQIGTLARGDIEGMLGMRVLLKLWVKVREDWRNRRDDLRTLGYE